VLAIARTVDVDADGEHRKAIEDGHRDGGVAEVPAPVAEGDVGGYGSGRVSVPAVDQVEEGVRGGGLVLALLDLPETDVVDDEQIGSCPGLEAARVGAVSEASVEVVEQVDTSCVAHGELLLASAAPEGLEDVALAGAARAGDHEVVVSAHEVEVGELGYEGLVESGLECPFKGLESLVLSQAADLDAASHALFELSSGLRTKDALEQRGGTWTLSQRPAERVIEPVERGGQAEEGKMSPESLEDFVSGVGSFGVGSNGAASLGHVGVS
jgi:hypothetical protein